MTHSLTQILQLSDAGHTPAQVATAVPTSLSTVYAVLRTHRPARPRAPRTRTGEKRRLIEGLLSRKWQPVRIATVLGVSPQYVYRIVAEQPPALPPPPY